MTEAQQNDNNDFDASTFIENFQSITAQSQKIISHFLSQQQHLGDHLFGDPLNINESFQKLTAQFLKDPQYIIKQQMGLWESYLNLWQNISQRLSGENIDPYIEPAKGDKRFKSDEWKDNIIFDFIKQSYLVTARWIQSTVESVEGLDKETEKKIDFYTRQFVDAMAPNNFILTNPDILKTTYETKGQNLVNGLQNLLNDLESGKGQLNIKMTDTDAFKVGENIAVTDGRVIYQNELMQLIQYSPSTKEVYQKPLLIIPPWINKYYILDLRPDNSYVKWLVDQGYTVFMISWVNPREELADKSFEDYLKSGPLDAMKQIEKTIGEKEINVIGYCLGGTLLATLLSYCETHGIKTIKSATFLTSMIDFEEAGELSVFIDDEQLNALEKRMDDKGYLDGQAMATTFNMLRANDLIWSFVINNYWLGKDPFPFDLLYWNSDSTAMPASMHSFYLRKMYLENALIEPEKIELLDTAIDIHKIKTPSFFLSTKDDHIAPWTSTYKATQYFEGPTHFCLSASGHIAGVVNPPDAQKYCYWYSKNKCPNSPSEWLNNSKEQKGSWWSEWEKWLQSFSGKKIQPRNPEKGKLKPLEKAPGSYVKK